MKETSFFMKEYYIFLHRTPKVSLVGVVWRAKNLFFHTSTGKFQVCVKLKQTQNFTALVEENQLSACKMTPIRLTSGIQRTKNTVRITCGKAYSLLKSVLALALKYAFLHLIRNILLVMFFVIEFLLDITSYQLNCLVAEIVFIKKHFKIKIHLKIIYLFPKLEIEEL